MKRTAEKILSIIAMILNGIGIIITFIMIGFYKMFREDPMIQNELKAEILADPNLTPTDVETVFSILEMIGGFLWAGVAVAVISIIFTIIGLVNIWNNKNSKLAGIMFIVGGLFAGIVTLPSILLYIAGILCFTRKSPVAPEDAFIQQQYDEGMRPL